MIIFRDLIDDLFFRYLRQGKMFGLVYWKVINSKVI